MHAPWPPPGELTLFGTDGIRGPYGSYPICADFSWTLGRALAELHTKTQAQPLIITCRDSRASGVALEHALHQGVLASGGQAISYGLAPTPALAYLITQHPGVAAGVVITASHNPSTDNGFKIFTSRGSKLNAAEQQQLSALIHHHGRSGSSGRMPAGQSPTTLVSQSPDAYQHYLATKLKELAQAYPQAVDAPLKLVIDCAHGATSTLAQALFVHAQHLPQVQALVIHSSPNGLNINDQVGATHIQALRKAVLAAQADFGVACDGDGDRLVLVDHHGTELTGSALLAILATWHASVAGSTSHVATTILANSGLDAYFKAQNITVLRSDVGDHALAELMATHDVPCGGEPSGHYLFREHLTTGDSLYALIQILHLSLDQRRIDPDFTWHAAARKVPLLAEAMHSITVPEKIPLAKLPAANAAIGKATAELKSASPTGAGRVLWRHSGTESKLRILVEGADQAQVERVAKHLAHTSLAATEQYLSQQP